MQKKCRRCGSYSEEMWMANGLCHRCEYDDYEAKLIERLHTEAPKQQEEL
jgi:NMD protein affecting ribosome stability and mRNA decay